MTNSCWSARPLGNGSCRLKEAVQNWHAAPMSIAARDKRAISQLAAWISAIFPPTALNFLTAYFVFIISSFEYSRMASMQIVLSLPRAWQIGERKLVWTSFGFGCFRHLPPHSGRPGWELKYSETIRPQPGRGETPPTSHCSFHLKPCAAEGKLCFSPEAWGDVCCTEVESSWN